MPSGKKVADATISLVNARILRLECARVFRYGRFVIILLYKSGAMVWREKERSKIEVVQMSNFRMYWI